MNRSFEIMIFGVRRVSILCLALALYMPAMAQNEKANNNRSGGIYNYVDESVADALAIAKEYTDEAMDEAIEQAAQLANTAKNEAIARAIELIDIAKHEAIQEAIQLANQAEANAIEEAEGLASQAKSEAIARAQELAAAARVAAIAKATELASEAKSEAIARAQELADAAQVAAIAEATELASTAESNAIAEAQNRIDDSKAEAIAEANNYTDNQISSIQGIANSLTTNEEGNIGIGTSSPLPGYKLAVAGKIRATEVKIDALPWPDYVFLPDYNLRTLTEVEAHIGSHGHLPDVPSAANVEEQGVSLGEMNAILLRKIEELTLYSIEQEKKLEKQNEMVVKQNQRIEELEQLIWSVIKQ